MIDFDLVYTVVAITAFVIGWTIAYARGYRAGHDDGFAKAVLDTRAARERRQD